MNANTQFTAISRPNPKELDYEITEIEGEIPKELHGALYRNGPNQNVLPKEGEQAMAFFEGDGMVRRVSFSEGKAHFQSAHVHSPSFRLEAEKGVYCMGGSNLAPNETLDEPMERVLANTNIVAHAGKLLAMAENSRPYALNMESLATEGEWDFNGDLIGPWTTAHPKLDAKTGQMVLHGYSTQSPYLQFYVIENDGKVSVAEPVDAPWPSLFHDLAITENFAAIPLGSAVYNPTIAEGNTKQVWDCLELDPSLNMRFGLRRREANAETLWCETPTPGNIFHVGNAYEKSNKIILDACTFKTPNVLQQVPTLRKTGLANVFNANLYLYEINPTTGETIETQLSDIPIEFPRIDDRFVGYENRYVFATTGDGGSDASGSLRRVSRFDFHTNEFNHADSVDGRWTSEPVFVPRSDDAEEGCGYILAYIFDANRDATGVEIRDAENVDQAPLATLWLNHRMPFDFHGNWVAAA